MNNTGEISDGYHTFNELYEHRNLLFLNLCKILYDEYSYDIFWNNNGDCEGWFCLYLIVNTRQPDGSYIEKQISYHLPEEYKKYIYFKYKECAWDGHTSKDVINLLKDFSA